MVSISDLQCGKAGEYLVCADLIMKGFVAFPSEQGLPFDVVAEINGKLVKIQVKTTRTTRSIPQRRKNVLGYIFSVKVCGKHNRQRYQNGDVDIFALVALDIREIAYLHKSEVKETMVFRHPNFEYDKRLSDRYKSIDSIKTDRANGMHYSALISKYRICESSLRKIISGETYKNIPFIAEGRYLSQYPIEKIANKL